MLDIFNSLVQIIGSRKKKKKKMTSANSSGAFSRQTRSNLGTPYMGREFTFTGYDINKDGRWKSFMAFYGH